MQLENKTVIITGAGSGIGAASAILLAKHKALVIVSDINIESAQKVADQINAAEGKAFAYQADVSKFEEVELLISQTVKDYGKLDVMVNNAGIGGENQRKTAEHTLEDWDNVIAVNQTGVFYCMKVALQQMMKQGHGNIINIASLAGLKPSGYNLSYSASKFAVVGMTKSAALEYVDKLLANRPDMGETLKRLIPMNRFGEVDEIAEAVAWLASDNSKYITGQTLTLDGGTSLL